MLNILEQYDAEHDIRQSTLDQYKWALSHFGKWLEHPVSPSDFSADTLNRYLAFLRDGRAPHTVAQRRNNLLVIWRWLHSRGLTGSAPQHVRIIRKPELPLDIWTPLEVSQLITHAENTPGRFARTLVAVGPFWAAWIRVAWDTALRPCDQAELRHSQIGERVRLVQRKTGRRITVSLRPETIDAIERFRGTEDLVWPAQLTARRRFSVEFQRLLRGSGLTGTAKMLRRSSGTEIERQHPGLGWVHLGHSSPSVAAKHYVNADRAYGERPLPELP